MGFTRGQFGRGSVALFASIVLTLALWIGPVPAAGAQSAQFKVQPVTFKHQPLSFKTAGFALKTQAVEFPVMSMVATVDSDESSAEKEVRFRLSGDVLFDFDKANIRPQAEVILANLAEKILRDFAGAPVRVEGHTDAKGEDSYNQALSERRAESVKRWFADSSSIPGDQIQTRGFGEKQPVAANTNDDGTDNPQGRQENRRVEIVVERRG